MEVVLITGCSSGIGRATALAFADAGWRVYATARDPTDIDDLAAAGCETAPLDVTNPETIDDCVNEILEASGRLDCAVNNAGYGQFGPMEDIPIREAKRQFDVNVHGVHRVIREVLPPMRDQGDGTIINVSSNLGRFVVPSGGVYCGSKFALEAMSDALRTEVRDFGVDVVVIEPGSVATGFHDRALEETHTGITRTDVYEPIYRLFEDGRLITREGPFTIQPETVAETILHAASCTNPAPRYPVGATAKLSMLTRFLPDRWRDRMYAIATKLAAVR